MLKLAIADIEGRGLVPTLGKVDEKLVRFYSKFGFVLDGEKSEMSKPRKKSSCCVQM